MSKPVLVGLVGYKNSGKTAITKALKRHFFINMIGFSNPLYKMLEAGFGITLDEIQNKSMREVPDARLEGRSIQYALNTLGTNWGREMISEDVWANRSLASLDPDAVNVADNVRFPNEFDAVRRHGGLLIAVKNAAVSNDGSAPEQYIEELQSKCDAFVENSMSFLIDDVAFKVSELIRENFSK